MNELMQQFLIESRELAEQATEGLLALERSPQDAEQLDGVFRAVHTLKGGAGIVDFFAMDRALHSAEDLLSAARAGKRVLTPSLVGDCLACIDQVLQWLDAMEQDGELPPASDSEADRVVARFKGALDSGSSSDPPGPSERKWVEELLARNPGLRAQTAVRYTPDPDCFFRGEDPISRLTALPGLQAFEVSAAMPWPPLAAMDPFRCNLVLYALTQADAAATNVCLEGHSGECTVVALAPDTETETETADDHYPAPARAILAAQLSLVRESTAATSRGHLASAALTASNVLRSCRQDAEAADLARLAATADAAVLLSPLQTVLSRLLGETPARTESSSAAMNPPAAPSRPDAASRTLRIDAARIDALVRLTGELTVARNALAHLVRVAYSESNPLAAPLKARHSAFEHLINDLQRSVLALRVLPLRVVFQRFPRLIREISDGLGKPVAVKVTGDDTEADKAIVEMLFEPLLHVVRNAIDHGIESTALRAERGKPRAATLELRAARQGDQVEIEITDDGGGMDVERIRSVAAARGMAAMDVLAAMDDIEVMDLVFAPGFSTATEVTALSGRGVGMDAVRKAVERVGGRVSIHSRAGQGTTVRFLLPFSVMMTTVMSVEAGGQAFGVPLDAVLETVRVPRSSLGAVGAARAMVVRGQTIPVFDLAQMLGDSGPARETADAIIVVTTFAGQRCGLDVDAVGERLDVILKPLDGLLANTPGITGTTVLGDGRVLLVLDIAELFQ